MIYFTRDTRTFNLLLRTSYYAFQVDNADRVIHLGWGPCPANAAQDDLISRRTRRALIQFGWFKVGLPETHQVLWIVVAHDGDRQHELVLIANVPLDTAKVVREIYADWRQGSYIEHGCAPWAAN